MPKVAINGFDRIGRAVFKIMLDTPEAVTLSCPLTLSKIPTQPSLIWNLPR